MTTTAAREYKRYDGTPPLVVTAVWYKSDASSPTWLRGDGYADKTMPLQGANGREFGVYVCRCTEGNDDDYMYDCLSPYAVINRVEGFARPGDRMQGNQPVVVDGRVEWRSMF